MDISDNSRCIGTKYITIKSAEGDKSESSGMLALFIEDKESTLYDNITVHSTSTTTHANISDSETNRGLIIMILDGNATFSSKMNLSNLRMTREEMKGKDPISWSAQTLLEGQEQSQSAKENHYHTLFSRGVDCTVFQIKFINSNKMVRVIYSQSISQTSSSSLPFLHKISLSLKQSTSTAHSLRMQLNKMESERNGWKDSATKLSTEHWKNEREQLMNRFLILLNRVKGDYRTANEKLSEEKLKYAVLYEKYKRLELELSKGKELVVDHIDEHDANLFDEAEAEKLAAGDRVDSQFFKGQNDGTKKRIANSSIGSSSNIGASTTTHLTRVKQLVAHGGSTSVDASINRARSYQSFEGSQPSNSSKRRKNPLTGSIEIWDAETMFSDSSSDEQEQGKSQKE